MQVALNRASEQVHGVFNRVQPSENPERILDELYETVEREFGGWLTMVTDAVTYRIPMTPENIYRQCPLGMRGDLEALFNAPHFQVDGMWYTMDPPRDTQDDLWETPPEQILQHLIARKQAFHSRNMDDDDDYTWIFSHIPGREPREIWEDRDWFNSVMMTIRGLLTRGQLTLPV